MIRKMKPSTEKTELDVYDVVIRLRIIDNEKDTQAEVIDTLADVLDNDVLREYGFTLVSGQIELTKLVSGQIELTKRV